MSTFVLVHGAWHGGWCWTRLAPILAARGHKVMAPDLPGMGADPTPLADVTLDLWAGFLAGLAEAAGEPVVMVGHSRGGVPISAAAERAPHAVRSLVYLTALLLPDGASAMTLASEDAPFEGAAAMQISEDGLSSRLDAAMAAPLLYNTTAPEWAAFALSRLGPEPLAPNVAPLSLTRDRYGSVQRSYVECLRDAIVPLGLQRRMQAAEPCAAVATLDTDHSPFLSAPEALADVLCELAAG